MGCGASASAMSQNFHKFEVTTPSQANHCPSEEIDKRVMIVGRVSAADGVIMPPFGPDDCVAIKVRVFRQKEAQRRYACMFSGLSAVDFNIRDAFGEEVRVDMSKPNAWSKSMALTHVAFNVARDSSKNGMVSGGEGPGQFSKQEFRPNAEAFWHEFSDGKDDWYEVTDMAGPGWAINRCRKATEDSIRLGDAIAVVGYLRKGDKSAFLQGGDGCFLSNRPAVAKMLTTVPTFLLPTDSTTRVQMRKGRDEANEDAKPS